MSSTNEILTIEKLKSMEPDTVFAHGEAINSPDHIYMTNSNIGKKLIWAAVRGAYWDWVIVTHWAENGLDYAVNHGDKIITPTYVKKLVPCEEEAFKMYRL